MNAEIIPKDGSVLDNADIKYTHYQVEVPDCNYHVVNAVHQTHGFEAEGRGKTKEEAFSKAREDLKQLIIRFMGVSNWNAIEIAERFCEAQDACEKHRDQGPSFFLIAVCEWLINEGYLPTDDETIVMKANALQCENCVNSEIHVVGAYCPECGNDVV